MENCLITQFKKASDNDSLKKIGELKFYVNAGQQGYIKFTSRSSITFRIVGDGYISLTDGGISQGKVHTVEFTDTATQHTIYFNCTTKCDVFIGDNYTGIRSFETVLNICGDFSQLNYKTAIANLILDSNPDAYGTIDSNVLASALFGLNITYPVNFVLSSLADNTRIMEINLTEQTGSYNISALAHITTITKLILINCRNYVGSLSSLYGMKDITTLNINASSMITGSVESLFEAWLDAGKTGTCRVTLTVNLLFNGIRLQNANVTFATDSIVVKDSNNNVLGTYNGSTWTYA